MFFRRRKESPPNFEQQLEAARAQGFTTEDAAAGRIRISKHGCAAVVEHAGGGRVQFVEKPGVLVNEEIAKLIDRGFQKFVVTSAGAASPALAEQLRAVHQFDEELRRVLHLESLYNESLGTVSNRYVYDRLQGRE